MSTRQTLGLQVFLRGHLICFTAFYLRQSRSNGLAATQGNSVMWVSVDQQFRELLLGALVATTRFVAALAPDRLDCGYQRRSLVGES